MVDAPDLELKAERRRAHLGELTSGRRVASTPECATAAASRMLRTTSGSDEYDT
jgi:hypothetical protein